MSYRRITNEKKDLRKDITETLEVIPRQWKMIQTVREKFSCRVCETITQPPAPPELVEGPSDGPRASRCRPARDDSSRQVRQPPALEPAEREPGECDPPRYGVERSKPVSLPRVTPGAFRARTRSRCRPGSPRDDIIEQVWS
jgi:hypothetical protein